MNETLKSIVGLLEGGRPELQVAAAQVLGELRTRDAVAVEALSDGLVRSPVLGRFCLEALAKIGSAPALRALAEAVVEHEVLSEHAAQLLGDVGAPAHGVLAKIYPQAIGEQRVRILGVLAREWSGEAVAVFAEALATPDLAEIAAGLLDAQAGAFAPEHARMLREALPKDLAESLPVTCVEQVFGVLARIDGNGSKTLFLKHTDAALPAAIRAAAFRGLQGVKLTANQVKAMTEALEDKEQRGVHDAVRDVLTALPELPAGMAPSLKRLLASRQPEQRLFAARMLRTTGGTELAKAFLKLLQHDDERFRVAAREALSNNKQAVEPVLKLLQTTKNVDLQVVCAQILASLREHLTPKLLKATAEKAVKLLATNPRLGDLMLDLALHAGGEKVAPMLLDKAVRLRRSKKVAEALHLLAKLATAEQGGDEPHYQIALTKLIAEAEAGEGEDSPGNSTMGFFAVLVRNGFPLFDRLKRESSVKPDMLLRVAQHFASHVGAERRFGAELLQHLAQRTKGRAGDEARLALRSVGI